MSLIILLINYQLSIMNTLEVQQTKEELFQSRLEVLQHRLDKKTKSSAGRRAKMKARKIYDHRVAPHLNSLLSKHQ